MHSQIPSSQLHHIFPLSGRRKLSCCHYLPPISRALMRVFIRTKSCTLRGRREGQGYCVALVSGAAFAGKSIKPKPTNENKMRAVAKISALIAFGFCTGNSVLSNAADQDQSFARVIYCQNDTGRARTDMPGSAMTRKGKPELRLGDRTVKGYWLSTSHRSAKIKPWKPCTFE